MMTGDDLKATERRAFRAVVDSGLWDVFLASVVAMFAIAPLLSGTLGDFWSAAVFLPVYGGLYLAMRLIRQRVVAPRVGQVRFGPYRTARLKRFTLVLLAVNVVALVLGFAGFALFEPGTGELIFPISFSLILLIGCSSAAYYLGIPRVFLYGLLLAVAPMVGEWLFRQGYASHHGFPIVFGAAAATIAAVGLIRFVTLVRTHSPVVGDGL